MTRTAPLLTMNDGEHIPQLGLGVMYIPTEEVPDVMTRAAGFGYRYFDTATHYGNEAGVGAGLRSIELPREELLVSTKLPNGAHGYDEALRAFERSEQAIGPIDLYLLHWPQPMKGKYRDSWRAMVRIREEGRVRSIGVCNFPAPLLDELADETGVVPAVNQIELHPAYPQARMRHENSSRGILTQSWSPLEHGRVLGHPTTVAIAERHGCSPATVVVRWHLDLGAIVIPKAVSDAHLEANIAALELSLTAEDHDELASLEREDGGFGPDPMLHMTDQGGDDDRSHN